MFSPSSSSRGKREVLQALEEWGTLLALSILLLSAGGGLACLPLDPLPDLDGLFGIDEDKHVLEGQLGDLSLYLAPVG